MMQSRIFFITGNRGKVESMKKHVREYDIEIEQFKIKDLVEIQSDNLQEIAINKARSAFQILKKPLVVEDSGFFISLYDKKGKHFPGPYVKYIIETIGAEGILKLLEDEKEDRACYFCSTLVFINDNGEEKVFYKREDEGRLSFEIDMTEDEEAWSDLWRIFIPKGFEKSLTSLTSNERNEVWNKWEKNSVFKQFAEYLKNL